MCFARDLLAIHLFTAIAVQAESYIGVLLAGVLPASYVPNACGVWLSEKVKFNILLFDAANPFIGFALLIEPLGRPIAFNFFFLNASSISPSNS